VTEVLPNGNLTIQGERTVTINREDSKMQVVGTIRARDVEPNNTIASTKVANAQIKLTGKGALWNNQRRGLVSRFLDWFSPF
jgi:flagellar L-ring protein precursor FlgH